MPMKLLYEALLFGGITALGAWCANRAISVYHDGARSFAREIRTGAIARHTAAQSLWKMSLGFVLYYGAPCSLATGVMAKHVLTLPADWIGARVSHASRTLLIGFLWGAAAGSALWSIHWGFGHLPFPINGDLLKIGQPLELLLPVIPVVACASQRGLVGGLVVGAVTLIVLAVAVAAGAPQPSAIGFGAGAVIMLGWTLRERSPQPLLKADATFVAGAHQIRRGSIPLAANGALFAIAASLFWLAGEPAAIFLIGLHQSIDAALVAIFSWFGFLPLATLTSLSSGVSLTGGMPDGILGVGFLAGSPSIAAPGGAVLMLAEIWGLLGFERLLARFPGLHGAGSAIRDGLLMVSEVALLIGGAVSSQAMWRGVGMAIVGGCWLLNEMSGRRVMRVAVGPLAAIAVGLLVNMKLSI